MTDHSPVRRILTDRRVWLVFAVSLFIALRLARVTADPPTNLARVEELIVEPVAKAYEARTWALFHSWQPNPADNYHFWRVQSPAWVYPLALWFRVFGVNYVTLRIFSTLIAAIGFAAFLLLAWRDTRRTTVFVAATVLGLNFYDILYQRSGLMEVAVGSWVMVMLYALYRAKDHWGWLLVAEWAWLLAFFSKQTGAIFLPVLLVTGGIRIWRWRDKFRPLLRFLPVIQFAVMAIGLAIYCTRSEYVRTVVRNTGHVIMGKLVHGSEDLGVPKITGMIGRYFTWRRWRVYFFNPSPVVAGGALLEMLVILVLFVRACIRRRFDGDIWLRVEVAVWFLVCSAPLALPQEELRFFIMMFAPAALLTGLLVSDITAAFQHFMTRGKRWVFWVPAILAVIPILYPHVTLYWKWIKKPKYEIVGNAALVRRLIGKRDVVVLGRWVPPIFFSTKYRYYYVRAEFNSTAAALKALRVGYYLTNTGADFVTPNFDRALPGRRKGAQRLGGMKILGRSATLYELKKDPEFPTKE